MRQKPGFIFIAILVGISTCLHAANSDNTKENKTETLEGQNNMSISSIDTSDTILFINQEIRYYAPLSDRIFLVWEVEDIELQHAVKWNADSRLNDGLLYTPMIFHGDTFSINLSLPKGSILHYYFWITRSKKGHYQDFWDLQSSGKTTVETDNLIVKNAIYTKAKKRSPSFISNKSWVLFIIIFVLYLIVWKVFSNNLNHKQGIPYFEKFVFTGLSLFIFLSLARSEILGIHPLTMVHNLDVFTKIVKGSLSDLLYSIYLLVPFLLLIWFINKPEFRKWLYVIFLLLALFSTLVAFINIKVVMYLGKPFNYQWLYYSDFLMSDESKAAMSSNFSLKTLVNLISFCISMLLLSGILTRIHQLIAINKRLKYVIYSLTTVLCVTLAIKSIRSNVSWPKGQTQNAVSSMIHSIITINANSSFFTVTVPKEMDAFDPTLAVQTATPVTIRENHHVKNVLFVILESAGSVYFDQYGGNFDLSPNLNHYSSHALMFENAYAHAPATNRSLISILASTYPFLSYKSLTQESPDIDMPTISSVLKQKGYRTSFFSSANLNFQNCREFLAHRDFDNVEDFSMINCDKHFSLDSEDYIEGNGIDDMCLVDHLTSWIDKDTTRSFFSLIWTVQGHYPYYYAGEEEDFGVADYNHNRYLNALKYNDKLLGRLMRELEWRGLDESTLVVVVGDHGEAFGQHGQYGHGTALYEENVKVPLYFINKTLFKGQQKNDLAGLKDLASTSLSIIGIDVPDEWQGRDLLQTGSEEVFFFAPWSDYLFAYRKNNLKYIFNESLNQVEVFDLKSDPQEKVNIHGDKMHDEIEYARNRIAVWVQYQDAFIKNKFVADD